MANVGDSKFDDDGLGGAGSLNLDDVEDASMDISGLPENGELVNGDVLALQAAWITEKV
jgi:hypothetical protein